MTEEDFLSFIKSISNSIVASKYRYTYNADYIEALSNEDIVSIVASGRNAYKKDYLELVTEELMSEQIPSWVVKLASEVFKGVNDCTGYWECIGVSHYVWQSSQQSNENEDLFYVTFDFITNHHGASEYRLIAYSRDAKNYCTEVVNFSTHYELDSAVVVLKNKLKNYTAFDFSVFFV